MTEYRQWAGTTGEYARLVEAVEHNCTCQRDKAGDVRVECPAHKMIEDQRMLNHLEFMARQPDRLREEEGL